MEDAEHGLVLPFVCCVTQGGPYDDTSFVAGCQFAQLEAELSRGPGKVSAYVYPALVGVLDLLAMRFGYTFTSEPWEDYPDEWALVVFEQVEARSVFNQQGP